MFEKVCGNVVTGICSVVSVLILFLTVFSNLKTNEYYTRSFDAPNILLLCAGMIFLLAIFCAVRAVSGKLHRRFDTRRMYVMLAAASAVLVLLQTFIAYSSLYTTGWDAGTVLNAAFMVSDPAYIPDPDNLLYFDSNPNNRFILVILIYLIRFFRAVGVSNVYFALTVFQCILMTAANALCFDLVRRLTGSYRSAWFSWIVFALFICLSPWLVIVYTDTMGLIFPILIFWIYERFGQKGGYLLWIALAVLSACAYKMKATCIIPFIAVVLTEIIRKLRLNRKTVIRFLITAFLIAVSMKAVTVVNDHVYEHVTGVEINEDMSKGMIHYLKTGLNEESTGTFNYDDDGETVYAADMESRNDMNIAAVKTRLKELFPMRLAALYLKKTKLNYSDGSFACGISGEEFIGTNYAADKQLTGISEFVREAYQPTGKYFRILMDCAQALWLPLLLLNVVFTFLFRKDRRYLPYFLSIIGIWMFTTIFEANPRYIIIYTAIYVLTAAAAVEKIARRK